MKFFYIRNLHLQSVVNIIPSIIYAKLQNILETRGKVSSENRPLDFRKYIVVTRGETMLQCVGKIWI